MAWLGLNSKRRIPGLKTRSGFISNPASTQENMTYINKKTSCLVSCCSKISCLVYSTTFVLSLHALSVVCYIQQAVQTEWFIVFLLEQLGLLAWKLFTVSQVKQQLALAQAYGSVRLTTEHQHLQHSITTPGIAHRVCRSLVVFLLCYWMKRFKLSLVTVFLFLYLQIMKVCIKFVILFLPYIDALVSRMHLPLASLIFGHHGRWVGALVQ